MGSEGRDYADCSRDSSDLDDFLELTGTLPGSLNRSRLWSKTASNSLRGSGDSLIAYVWRIPLGVICAIWKAIYIPGFFIRKKKRIHNEKLNSLHMYCEFNQLDHIRECVEEDSFDVNMPVSDKSDSLSSDLWEGDTALTIAVKLGNADAVRIILEAGASVDLRDRFGATPLITAAAWGTPDIVEILVKAGADVNAMDKSGRTPLMAALDHDLDYTVRVTRKDVEEMVRLLLEAGARTSPKDADGHDARWFAKAFEHTKVVRNLLKNAKE